MSPVVIKLEPDPEPEEVTPPPTKKAKTATTGKETSLERAHALLDRVMEGGLNSMEASYLFQSKADIKIARFVQQTLKLALDDSVDLKFDEPDTAKAKEPAALPAQSTPASSVVAGSRSARGHLQVRAELASFSSENVQAVTPEVSPDDPQPGPSGVSSRIPPPPTISWSKQAHEKSRLEKELELIQREKEELQELQRQEARLRQLDADREAREKKRESLRRESELNRREMERVQQEILSQSSSFRPRSNERSRSPPRERSPSGSRSRRY